MNKTHVIQHICPFSISFWFLFIPYQVPLLQYFYLWLMDIISTRPRVSFKPCKYSAEILLYGTRGSTVFVTHTTLSPVQYFCVVFLWIWTVLFHHEIHWTFDVFQTPWHHNQWLNAAAAILIKKHYAFPLPPMVLGRGDTLLEELLEAISSWAAAFSNLSAMVIKFDGWFTVSFTSAHFVCRFSQLISSTSPTISHFLVIISLIFSKEITMNTFKEYYQFRAVNILQMCMYGCGWLNWYIYPW